ncbi:hypothetical protein V1478_008237 [Vespula squamosa]|uniref:Uncharacterized protein n=1 Tax=Vespula squamosa TaxID=30214 RepID=A0ABD2AY74_VESSQ
MKKMVGVEPIESAPWIALARPPSGINYSDNDWITRTTISWLQPLLFVFESNLISLKANLQRFSWGLSKGPRHLMVFAFTGVLGACLWVGLSVFTTAKPSYVILRYISEIPIRFDRSIEGTLLIGCFLEQLETDRLNIPNTLLKVAQRCCAVT